MDFKLKVVRYPQKVSVTGLPELVAREVEKFVEQGFEILNEGKYDKSRVFVDLEKPRNIEEH